jgi:hypothetical protein
MSKAAGPLTRATAMPPKPVGVEIAQIVSLEFEVVIEKKTVLIDSKVT